MDAITCARKLTQSMVFRLIECACMVSIMRFTYAAPSCVAGVVGCVGVVGPATLAGASLPPAVSAPPASTGPAAPPVAPPLVAPAEPPAPGLPPAPETVATVADELSDIRTGGDDTPVSTHALTRLVVLPFRMLRPGPRLPAVFEDLAHLIHPERWP